MKVIIITILITLFFVVGLELLIKYVKKQQQRRDDEQFFFILKEILGNENIQYDPKIEKAKEWCRMTEGEKASGAYYVLINI